MKERKICHSNQLVIDILAMVSALLIAGAHIAGLIVHLIKIFG